MSSFLYAYNSVASWAFLILSLVLLCAAIFAIVHAVRTPADAFRAAGKWQKNYWIIALAVCALVSFLPGYIGLMICAVGVLVYLLDARPKLDEVRRPKY